MELSHKICCRCKVDLPIGEFYRDKTHKDGRKSACRVCQPPVRFNSSQHRKHSWTKRYGITPKEYETKLLEQNGCCAICGAHHSKFLRKLAVDHDHTTNQIRGLLCMRCNLILGNALDTHSVLIKAARYLEIYKMMPQMPMPQTPAPSMGAPEPSAMGGEQMPQEGGMDVKAMLIQVLQKAKKMAEQNGIDFEELIDSMGGEESEEAPAPVSAPKPPSSMGQL